MKLSLLRPVSFAGAMAIAILSNCLEAAVVDVPLPEAEMPALAALVETALARSPRVMSRDLELAGAQYQEMVSSARLYPQVGGSIVYQVRDESRSAGLDPGLYDRTNYSVTASQSLWHWGNIRAAARIGELSTKIAERNIEATRRAVALEVRSAYLALIVQKMGVRNARLSEQRIQEALVVQEARYKAKEITSSVLSAARFRAEESSLAVERAAFDFELSIRAFRRLAGVESFSEADIPDALVAPKREPGTYRSETSAAYLKSEALMVNELQIEQGKLNLKIDRKALWPKLNAIVGATQDDNLYSTTLGDRITTTSVFAGLQVQWTIFDGFSSKGRRLNSVNRLRQLEDSRSDLIDSLKNSADQQAANVGFSWRAYNLSRQRHQGAASRLAYEKENLARGLSSEEQITDAEAALNQAELVANDALAKFYSAAARYASTMHADPLLDGR